MAFTLFLFLAFATAPAQDLGLRYLRGVGGNSYRYSGNGSFVFSQAFAGGVNVYRIADNTLIASLAVQTDEVKPIFDGSGFYYKWGREIWFYNVASRFGSLLYSEDLAYGGIENLGLSAGNGLLSFQSKRQSDGRYTVGLINLSTGSLAKRYVLPDTVFASQMEFVNSDQHLLIGGSGLRLYSVAGGLVSTRATTSINWFTVHPDRTKVYAVDGSNTETVALNVAGSISVIWKKGPIGLSSAMKVSSDGKVLIDQVGTSSEYLLRSFTTADGSMLPGFMNPEAPGSFVGYEAAPDKNEVILPTFLATARIEKYSFDSNTGSGTQLADLNEGSSYGVSTLGSSGPALISTTAYGSGGFQNVRTAADGVYTGLSFGHSPGPPPLPQMVSPNGKFYVRIGYKTGTTGWGLHVHKFPTDELVASHAFVDAWDNPLGYGWGNDTRLYVFNHTTKRLRVLSFDGIVLTRLREFVDVPSQEFKMSADGKRIVAWNVNSASESSRIYNVQDGSVIGHVPMMAENSSGGVPYWTIVGQNLLAIHQWVIVDGIKYKNQVRFYDLNNASLPLVNVTGYIDNEQQVYDYGITRITPDGSMVIFMLTPQNYNADHSSQSKITIMRVSDNTIVRQVTNLPISSVGAYTSGTISLDGSAFFATNNLGALVSINIPPVVALLKVNPDSVAGGANATGTVTLSLPAPSGGTTVALVADAGVGVPASITISEGERTSNFVVTTTGVDSDVAKNVVATLDGISLAATFTVRAAKVVQLSLTPPSVEGGQSSTGNVALDAQAGPSGVTLSLSSDKSFATVPGSVSISSGQSTAPFTANTSDPGATAIATISATGLGEPAKATLEVKSKYVITPVLAPAVVKGGNATELKLSISPVADVDKTFTLVGDPLLSPPASITIPAGQVSVVIGIKTIPTSVSKLADLNITNAQGFNKTVTVTVQAPLVTGLLPTVTSVTGATTIDVLVLLDGPAPENFTLAASSTAPTVATVPESVSVPAGAVYALVKVTVKRVTTKRTPTIKIGDKSFILTAYSAQ